MMTFPVERVTKIRSRLEDSLGKIAQVEYDRGRLEQELIYYIEKLDVNEEKQRLAQHLSYFIETLRHALIAAAVSSSVSSGCESERIASGRRSRVAYQSAGGSMPSSAPSCSICCLYAFNTGIFNVTGAAPMRNFRGFFVILHLVKIYTKTAKSCYFQ